MSKFYQKIIFFRFLLMKPWMLLTAWYVTISFKFSIFGPLNFSLINSAEHPPTFSTITILYEQRDQSAGFGTQAHSLIEDMINTGMDDVPCSAELEPTRKAFISWKNGLKATGSKVLKTEVEVWSDEYGYAGTMDAILETVRPSGERILTALDWKTSNAMRNEYALQVAAYAKAYEERTGQKVARALIVRFGKRSETFEAKQVIDLERSFDAFCSALHLFHSMNKPML